MLIDGELVEAASGRRFERRNPATGELAGTAPDGGVEDLERAVAAARRVADAGGSLWQCISGVFEKTAAFRGPLRWCSSRK